jgi:multidrug efflux pump subunit AcrB
MLSLTKFGVESSRFTVFIMLSLIIVGVASYLSLAKREDPSITIRTAVVSAFNPGMDPIMMEELVADPIERQARKISEIKDIKSLITHGRVVVYLDLHDNVPSDELTDVMQNIRNKMLEVSKQLPAGTFGPDVNTEYGDVAIATIAVTGEEYTYKELVESAKFLRKELYSLQGIGQVEILGEQEERIWLEIDFKKLASVGVQIRQVLKDLQEQNVILPAGEINVSGSNLTLTANGELKTVDEIKNVLTLVPSLNTKVRLEDILTVKRDYVEPKKAPIYFNGQPAIILSVQMSDGQDLQVLGKKLKILTKQLEQTQAVGIEYLFSTFQASNVSISINDALANVIQTAVTVLLILVIFLGWRSAIVVAFIVPFTVMFTVIAMVPMAIELQVVSIAAVIIALGLLVDNGLVIVEDIQNKINAGVSAKDAAYSASKQFSIPLAVASVTTISAFLPLLLLNGSEGEYAYSLGAVVGVMLFGSWISAIYLLPPLCVWSAKKQISYSQGENLAVRIYGRLLSKLLPRPVFILIISYCLVIISANLMSQIPKEMFPLSERNQFLIYLEMPKGTSISATEEEALDVIAWLSDRKVNPEIENSTLYVGDGGPRFYLSLNPADKDESSAFILVNTHDFKGAKEAADRAQRYLYEHHPSARSKIKRLSMGGKESGIVEINISGPDIDQLLSSAKKLEAAFALAPNIIQNENNWGNKIINIEVDISQDKARDFGITSRNISEIMDAFYSGYHVSDFREGTYSIPIVVRANEEFRNSLEDLKSMAIPLDGSLKSLEHVASFVPKVGVSQIRRENQRRTIKISAKSSSLTAQNLLLHIQPMLDELDLPDGYQVVIGGEIADSAEVNQKLAAGLPLALFVMIAALTFQFNSFRRVSLILSTIPLVIVGVPVGLIMMGQPLSFFGTLGLISLAGIIINNAIILIDQVDIEKESLELKEAIVSASMKRVTPILLTTLTTVVGLIPMALAGGALFEPMASVMIGGLMVGSLLTLLFVPCAFYTLFGNLYFKNMVKPENIIKE